MAPKTPDLVGHDTCPQKWAKEKPISKGQQYRTEDMKIENICTFLQWGVELVTAAERARDPWTVTQQVCRKVLRQHLLNLSKL